MVETAVSNDIDCIITRNTKDYSKANIPVYLPSDFLNSLVQSED